MKGARAFSLEGITKTYPLNGVTACREISLEGFRGEILALMGENGAGKTTLARILTGRERASAGRVRLDGSPPCTAGLVTQHPPQGNGLRAREYLAAGQPAALREAELIARAEDLLKGAQQPVPPWNQPAPTLSPAERQRLELAGLLIDGREILILDEPTAALTEGESQSILAWMRALRDQGKCLIFITHKMREIEAVADRLALLYRGELCLWGPRSQYNLAQITDALMGLPENNPIPPTPPIQTAPPIQTVPPIQPKPPAAGPLLEAYCLREEGSTTLHDITFALSPGEILGIAGFRESGLLPLEDLLTGWGRRTSGMLRFRGQDITGLTPGALRRRGITMLPAHRLLLAGAADLSLEDNLNLHRFYSPPENRQLLEDFQIKGHLREPLSLLSGGNQHKVILARELREARELLIIAEPAWGLDTLSRQMILHKIRGLAAAGCAVLLLSSDPEDLLDTATRILFIREGTLHTPPEGVVLDHRTLGEALL